MTKRVLIGLLAALVLLSLIGVVGVGAQAQSGTVRGTVFEDLNSDGVCVGTGEPGLAGIPIQFVHQAPGNATIVVQSTQNGTYSLVGIGLETWRVTVQPPSGFAATSQQSFLVTLTGDQPEVTGIDFCVGRVSVTPTATSAPTATPTSASSLMPESGAAAPPTLLIVGAIGIAMFALGAGIAAWRRRES